MKLYVVVIALVCFQFSQSRSIEKDCHGLTCEEYDQTQDKIVQILNLINPAPAYSSPNYVKETLAPLDGTLDGCIRLSNEQAEDILNDIKYDNSTNEEWKMHDFKRYWYNKWDINQPIKYSIDPRFDSRQVSMIKKGISMWEQNTCLRWKEYPFQSLRQHHIQFTKGEGCNSYIGKMSHMIPQIINFHANCFHEIGTQLHEIGHSLGLWHEQTRFDRDQYITINYENINKIYAAQFNLERGTVSLGVPYDYNSMMHYGPKDGSSLYRRPTMNSKDPRFQSNMGQGSGLSFLDTKIINLEYCKSVCHTNLAKSCENDGYQDPNNCNQCKCPDGLGGQYCETVAASVGATCGGIIHLKNNRESITIETPGFSMGKKYDNFIECSWLILAPAQHKLKMSFGDRDNFHIFRSNADVCSHWLEVKSEGNLGANGPRLCGVDKPKDIVSTEERMLLVFKSNWNINSYFRTGFKATISAVSDSGSNNVNTDHNNSNNNNNPNCTNYYGDRCKNWLDYCDDHTTGVPDGCKKSCNHC